MNFTRTYPDRRNSKPTPRSHPQNADVTTCPSVCRLWFWPKQLIQAQKLKKKLTRKLKTQRKTRIQGKKASLTQAKNSNLSRKPSRTLAIKHVQGSHTDLGKKCKVSSIIPGFQMSQETICSIPNIQNSSTDSSLEVSSPCNEQQFDRFRSNFSLKQGSLDRQ